MNWTIIGEMVNTHGIKGEIRIISDFPYKKEVFRKGTKLYFGTHKEEETIVSYRMHKMFDMVVLKDITKIEDVLPYKGEFVYIDRNHFTFPGPIPEDLIGLTVYTTTKKGTVTQIIKSKAHDILVIEQDEKKYMVPYIPEFIELVDLDYHKIVIKEMKGLFDED